LVAPELADILALDDASFRTVFAGSPIKRIGRAKMIRNALIAAGNSGDPVLIEPVVRLLDDPVSVVRDSAIWALARLDRVRFLNERAGRILHEADDGIRAAWASADAMPADRQQSTPADAKDAADLAADSVLPF